MDFDAPPDFWIAAEEGDFEDELFGEISAESFCHWRKINKLAWGWPMGLRLCDLENRDNKTAIELLGVSVPELRI